MPNTREKLIELLEDATVENIAYIRDGQPVSGGFIKLVKDGCAGRLADNLIAHGVTVQEWISVKDRLPEAHRLVLCRWTRGIGASYGFARYNHDIDVWYVSNEGVPEVTHWMPLPEPPKGE